MSDDVRIRVEGLGKKYVIGHEAQRDSYTALRDVISRNTKALVQTTVDLLRGRAVVAGDAHEEFWALKDVNFKINRGDVVGIVGRNGAGKSTLLKILSRITEPTLGRVEIHGRVASLLEVGTGFHPELSGRENIFLNGAILGMSRAEVRRKFDEIVDFSGVERFLDTPVKRYSSGMQVRLAFAVAAHLEPEILLVDEVLAVGDAEFQKKCLGKMHDVAGHGRTVLFVSHQLGMVARLCNKCILLAGGTVASFGPTRTVLDDYVDQMEALAAIAPRLNSAGGPYISRIATLESDGTPGSEFFLDQEITVQSTVTGRILDPGTLLTTTLVGRDGDYVCTEVTSLQEVASLGANTCSVRVTFPKSIIAPNDYYFRVALFTPPSNVLDLHELAAPIKVRDSGSPMSAFEGISYGHVILRCQTLVTSDVP